MTRKMTILPGLYQSANPSISWKTLKICALITSIQAIMTVLSCSDLLTGLFVSGSPKVGETNKERTVIPASMRQLLQTIL